MRSFKFQSIARISVLVTVGTTLMCTQLPETRKVATQVFVFEVILLFLFALSSMITWKRSA